MFSKTQLGQEVNKGFGVFLSDREFDVLDPIDVDAVRHADELQVDGAGARPGGHVGRRQGVPVDGAHPRRDLDGALEIVEQHAPGAALDGDLPGEAVHAHLSGAHVDLGRGRHGHLDVQVAGAVGERVRALDVDGELAVLLVLRDQVLYLSLDGNDEIVQDPTEVSTGDIVDKWRVKTGTYESDLFREYRQSAQNLAAYGANNATLKAY